MAVVPFVVYFALIGLTWFLLARAAPPVLRTMRRGAAAIAAALDRRGVTERWLSFLPPRVLHLKPYAGLILLVALGLVVTLVAGDEFFDLAERMRNQSELLLRIDHGVHAWTQSNRHLFLTPFYLVFTIIGQPWALALLLAIGVAICLLRREWGMAGFLVFTGAVGGLLNRWLKQIFARERPDLALALTDAARESFPSGHAMGSVIVLGALAWVTVKLGRDWTIQSLIIAAAAVTVVVIAASRIYLGVHWVSDIAAGLAAGVCWLATTIVAWEIYAQIRRRRKKGFMGS
jgi:membrane-associated phospholipid phosphatase